MKVGDNHRTNPLSHKPGGGEVRITFVNGKYRDYDKVKYPQAFIEKCFDLDDSILEAQVLPDGKVITNPNSFEYINFKKGKNAGN
tara:strand:+ start:1045 stop:1299 length:255 start_codon:yes stop_codon:yes gene_type:complete